jgi:acylphosphatase
MRSSYLLPDRLALMSVSVGWFLLTGPLPPAQADMIGQKFVAVSGVVTGNVQGVGFRAMIQKQAIQYNLAGSAENKDKSVQFVLQGPGSRIDQALKTMRKGTKKSSDVTISVSTASADGSLNTFTVFGWTSISRHISHPYNLVFNRRNNDTIISKEDAKEAWLRICENTVQGEDVGKCNKDDSDFHD